MLAPLCLPECYTLDISHLPGLGSLQIAPTAGLGRPTPCLQRRTAMVARAPFLKTRYGGYFHRDVPEEDAELTHVTPAWWADRDVMLPPDRRGFL
jgi:hypothetical protein